MTHINSEYWTAKVKKSETGMRSFLAALLLGATALTAVPGIADAKGKFLYLQSNNHEAGQNSVIVYERASDGSLKLHPDGPFLSGGTGIDNNTNGKLGPNDNDTPIIAGPNDKRLFAVNGNSNTIAVFDIMADGSLKQVPGSPFASMGIGPASLSVSENTLLVANRNEDPAQLEALQGANYSSYVSFHINEDGSLKYLSKIENLDGHKSSQVLFSATNANLAIGNDFQVDADFDGEGEISKLFSKEQYVRGRLQTFKLSSEGNLVQADRHALQETANPAPEVPTVPLGIWSHPSKNLVYVGLVTRNQLGVYRLDDDGILSFVSAVPNSGQDICWIRINKAGTRLYAVNNLARDGTDDAGSTITLFDISGDKALNPVEISRTQIPLPLGTFVNNRVADQPNSTAFQLTLDDAEEFLYVINQRIDQTAANSSDKGNLVHSFKIGDGGELKHVASRHLIDDGVKARSRPQGLVAIDIQ